MHFTTFVNILLELYTNRSIRGGDILDGGNLRIEGYDPLTNYIFIKYMLTANIRFPTANNYNFGSCSLVRKPDPVISKYECHRMIFDTAAVLSHAVDSGTTSVVKNIFGVDIYK